MSDFDAASAVTPTGGGDYRVQVPDGWQQGRGAFGGLVLGMMVRAMRATEMDASRRLRALTGDLCGPATPGEGLVRVEVLRRGKSLSNLDARLVAKNETVARASAVFASARKVDARPVPAVSTAEPRAYGGPPSLPPFAEITPLDMAAFAPVFAKHYEYRAIDLPFAGAVEPIARGFIRLRVPPPIFDEATIIGLLDAWWPALFSVERSPRSMATVSFTAEIVSDISALRADQPLAYAGRVIAMREGFFVEARELWSGSTLVAMNQQTFAILA